MTLPSSRRLIFLPGAAGSPEFWRPVGDRLLEPDKVYLGWPGLGSQPADPLLNGIEDLVGLTEAALGPGENVLIAQSMGGYVALRCALKRPDAVTRLVLAVTSGGVDAAVNALKAHDWRPAFQEAFPHSADWILQPQEDLTHLLPRITCPTLLLFGGQDPIAPLFVGERLSQLLSSSELVVFPHADHDLVQTNTEAAANLISNFLRLNHVNEFPC